jgi:hypothetical protein
MNRFNLEDWPKYLLPQTTYFSSAYFNKKSEINLLEGFRGVIEEIDNNLAVCTLSDLENTLSVPNTLIEVPQEELINNNIQFKKGRCFDFYVIEEGSSEFFYFKPVDSMLVSSKDLEREDKRLDESFS